MSDSTSVPIRCSECGENPTQRYWTLPGSTRSPDTNQIHLCHECYADSLLFGNLQKGRGYWMSDELYGSTNALKSVGQSAYESSRAIGSVSDLLEKMEFSKYEILCDQRFVTYEYKDLKWLVPLGLAKLKPAYVKKMMYVNPRDMQRMEDKYEDQTGRPVGYLYAGFPVRRSEYVQEGTVILVDDTNLMERYPLYAPKGQNRGIQVRKLSYE